MGSYFVIEKSYKYLAFCRCDETESYIPSMWICLSSLSVASVPKIQK